MLVHIVVSMFRQIFEKLKVDLFFEKLKKIQ